MDSPPKHFTATRVARKINIKPQSVRWHLLGIAPAVTLPAAAWTVEQFPEKLLSKVEDAVIQGNPVELRRQLKQEFRQRDFRHIEQFLSMDEDWQPVIPWHRICDEQRKAAIRLRDVLLDFVSGKYDRLSRVDREAAGVREYQRAFGYKVSARYFRSLIAMVRQRAGGAADLTRPELYLRGRLREKNAQVGTASPELREKFPRITNYIQGLKGPASFSEGEWEGLWGLVHSDYKSLVNAGVLEKVAARQLRQLLFEYKNLFTSRDALLVAFKRKMERLESGPHAISDRRKSRPKRVYPEADLELIRTRAAGRGRRINEVWRLEYENLSDFTKGKHKSSRRCPRTFYDAVKPAIVKQRHAARQGPKALNLLIPSITRDATNVKSMARWSLDDMTCNIEVSYTNPDGSVSLIVPQVVVAMDFASRNWVGWAISPIKAPTSRLACAAFLDGVKKHGVPQQLWIEGGFVFGKSININGKEEDDGRVVHAGLARYGCSIHRLTKNSPTSKGELERSFETIQRDMEPHHGYGGRNQRFDASEDFKKQQRLIRSRRMDPSKCRYDYDEFKKVFAAMVKDYNGKPQYGHLNGRTPDAAFDELWPHGNPPTYFDENLQWLLASAKYLVDVRAGGFVTFTHYGEKITVIGTKLLPHVGEELWAVVDRDDSSDVSFMSKDNHHHICTLAACKKPSAVQTQVDMGNVLENEIKIRKEQKRALRDEWRSGIERVGDERVQLMEKVRGQDSLPVRQVIVDPRMAAANEEGERQRQENRESRKRSASNKNKARRMNIPSILVDDTEQSRRALELLGDTPKTDEEGEQQ